MGGVTSALTGAARGGSGRPGGRRAAALARRQQAHLAGLDRQPPHQRGAPAVRAGDGQDPAAGTATRAAQRTVQDCSGYPPPFRGNWPEAEGFTFTASGFPRPATRHGSASRGGAERPPDARHRLSPAERHAAPEHSRRRRRRTPGDRFTALQRRVSSGLQRWQCHGVRRLGRRHRLGEPSGCDNRSDRPPR